MSLVEGRNAGMTPRDRAGDPIMTGASIQNVQVEVGDSPFTTGKWGIEVPEGAMFVQLWATDGDGALASFGISDGTTVLPRPTGAVAFGCSDMARLEGTGTDGHDINALFFMSVLKDA